MQHSLNMHKGFLKLKVGSTAQGVLIYVKDTIAFVRRHDLEVNNTECIWVELKLCRNKNVLFAVFYRPPNSDMNYQTQIETSFGLATDTGINDIIITGDFNLNVLTDVSKRKVDSLCQQNYIAMYN